MKTGQPVLCINRNESYCRACGKNCDPNEKTHQTVLGWSAEARAKPGCGVTYIAVTSDYMGLNMKEVNAFMKPDLPWLEVGDTLSLKA